MRRRLLGALLGATLIAPAAAPAPAQGRPGEPRDTTPPAAYFGVTEYQLAREKLELDMQRDGFTVYIIADMEGLAAAVRNRTRGRGPGARAGRRRRWVDPAGHSR